MGRILDQSVIAHTLTGEWRIGASNIDPWVNGTRLDALFRFTIEQESPLILTEEQIFTTADGKERRLALTNHFAHGEFISKSRRIGGTMSRWSIGGMDLDRGILIVRMTHARGGQDGLIVFVRDEESRSDLRATIAINSDEFSVGLEDFASLSWLPSD
ncbi:MAG: hypothetical protein IT190_03975 [Microbacteriaceae bacterium]|nr:hypothetical protein [Microbacteriaceae bacterium]